MRLTVKKLDEVSEMEWLSMPQLNGITVLNNLSKEVIDEKLLQGWTCLTPSLLVMDSKDETSVDTLWVEPEKWAKLENALKKHQVSELRDNALTLWTESMSEAGIIDYVKHIKSEGKGKQKTSVFITRHWSACLLDVHTLIRTQAVIEVERQKIEKLIDDFIENDVLCTAEEFYTLIGMEEKWNALMNFSDTTLFPEWVKSAARLNESQRSTWYSWIRNVFEKITLNENTEKNMLSKFDAFLKNYAFKMERLKKEAKWIEAENLVNFNKFEEAFEIARTKKRKWTFFMGPPNTGKTYNSFKMLADAASGYYWAPLRLLALEGYENLWERGVPNDLVTGEERKKTPGSFHVSSTVEMANWNKEVDVAVLDEVQLLTDKNRGWAWTQAVLGATSDDLVLTGSEAALPYVKRMVAYLGDELEVVKLFSEKQLRRDKAIMDWKRLKNGDAIVTFSRKDALSWKEAAERRGWKVSVIYGNLSPEVRAEQARKFREGETEILVATDAIGLGLNLPIKRIVFAELSKFDGEIERLLKPSEVWQIANRAGRKGWVEEGAVTTWTENDEVTLWQLLDSKDESPRDLKWWVQPLPSQIETWHKHLGGTLPQWLSFFVNNLLKDHPVFKPCAMEEIIDRSYEIEKMSNLTIVEKYAYATAPVDSEDEESESLLLEWANRHNQGLQITWNDVKEHWLDKEHYHSRGEELYDAEKRIKILTVYRWLIQRFPDVYSGLEEAEMEHVRINAIVERALDEIVRRKESIGRGAGTKMKKDFRKSA